MVYLFNSYTANKYIVSSQVSQETNDRIRESGIVCNSNKYYQTISKQMPPFLPALMYKTDLVANVNTFRFVQW